jgi:phosphate transport system permease protein
MAELVSALDLRPRRSWRSTKNILMTVVLGAAVVAIAIPLVMVMYSVFAKGGGILFKDFPAFLTSKIPPTRAAGPGMGPAIVGTLEITGMATLIAVPLGVLGAIYLNEYGGQSRFAQLVRFLAMVMTGVPSIVMGLFIYVVWTLNMKLQGFGGSLALACLMLPIVINASEQMLRLVPNGLREASYALGATKARTIITIVLPAASSGIVSGSLLAVARAAGETAPLLFTIGATRVFNTSLFHDDSTALSARIFENAKEAVVNAQERGWGAALALVLLTFTLTVIARVITAFATRRK